MSLLCINRWIEEEFGENGKVYIEGIEHILIIGGDRGYKLMSVPEFAKLMLTMSAEKMTSPQEEAAAASRGKNKAKRKSIIDEPHVVIDERFFSYRSVVERSIGWLKQTIQFLAGRIYNTQLKRLGELLPIACALANKALSENPELFARDR